MAPGSEAQAGSITYRQYLGESDLAEITRLIGGELSEPYSVFTYRYFLAQWPELCWIAYDGEKAFGTVVCKMDWCRVRMRGYLAMLCVDRNYRGKGVGSQLVQYAIQQMIRGGCEEVVLEAEVTNSGALRLYESLGFIRDKRLHRYYLNGADAYRLKLLLPAKEEPKAAEGAEVDLKPEHVPEVLAQEVVAS